MERGIMMLSTKRINLMIFIILILFVTACAGQTGGNAGSSGSDAGNGSSTNLSGSALEILGSLDEALKQTGIEMPMTLPPLEVQSDMAQNDVGLSSADFDRLVTSAASSLAAIGTFAHQIVIIQANGASAATQVKNLISGSGGYDAQKWICVWPDKVIVVESGAYVLLAAAKANVVDAAIEAFKNEAGTIGTVVTFFEHDGSLDAPIGGGEPIAVGGS